MEGTSRKNELKRTNASLDLTKMGQTPEKGREQGNFAQGLYPPSGEAKKGTQTIAERSKALGMGRVPDSVRTDGPPVKYNETNLTKDFQKIALAERTHDRAKAVEAAMPSLALKNATYGSRADAQEALKARQQELEAKVKNDPKNTLRPMFEIGKSNR